MIRKNVNFDVVCFPLVLTERKKINRKFTFFPVNTKSVYRINSMYGDSKVSANSADQDQTASEEAV